MSEEELQELRAKVTEQRYHVQALQAERNALRKQLAREKREREVYDIHRAGHYRRRAFEVTQYLIAALLERGEALVVTQLDFDKTCKMGVKVSDGPQPQSLQLEVLRPD